MVAVASTTRFDACPHAGADDLAMSSLCLPIESRSTIGVLWSTGPEGDLPTPAETAALRRRLLGRGRDRDLRDPLTGLPNHATAHRMIRDLVEALTPFSLALCNIDGFGEFNTRHGRDGGDLALRTLTSVLGETLRPDDIVCRYGGDTFLAVFPNCSTLNAAAAMERVRESLVLHLAESGQPAFTCSSGVADSNQGTSIDDLLGSADLAMSMAKYEGGNRVRTAIFEVEDHPSIDRSADLN